ncbi:hypothetical protein COCMIDRAFT_30652 [Bipolaris oryzae ATCC 44560]|uniref:Uncharacterized protein n=1 Tax=Bipolaris oryzae ATCC 44560 TaxID=930090 RepID=W6YRZ2_COCMI|nr:uncharacterized protein COCMIDRAFT_30652 [Bipolaris oryzae ATCC 44560]EUC40405.1 hypothetical protein COCMIDRAFT_30652 [Bipolaris oryzae ATCC 44560]
MAMELTDSEKGLEDRSGAHSQHSTADFAEGGLVLVSEGPALTRTFTLLSACAIGITTGNSWAVMGAGIRGQITSLRSGEAAGAIYEYVVVSIFYGFTLASIAELASSIPSSGVYHWTLVTAGTKYGKTCG